MSFQRVRYLAIIFGTCKKKEPLFALASDGLFQLATEHCATAVLANKIPAIDLVSGLLQMITFCLPFQIVTTVVNSRYFS